LKVLSTTITMVVVRSYRQYCSVAKALDVVGDRWTLLIVRELMIQGGCRYTDLVNGLPGIATNLLTERLRELEDAGIVEREAAPPPVATTLYHLTEAGNELRPTLTALGRWGVRYMTAPTGDESFRSHWLAFPVSEFLRDSEPTGPPLKIEVRTGDHPAVIEVNGGSISTRLGHASSPDLILHGEPSVILGVLTGNLTGSEARRLGLRTTGRVSILRRLQPPAVTPRVDAPTS
jgi:DNA-binding HxlR family transcriptional regulator